MWKTIAEEYFCNWGAELRLRCKHQHQVVHCERVVHCKDTLHSVHCVYKCTVHCANAAKKMCIVHCNGTVYCANAANLLCAVCTAKALCTVLALQRNCALCQLCNAPGYALHQLRSAVHHLPKELQRFNDCCCCAPVYHDYQTFPPWEKI